MSGNPRTVAVNTTFMWDGAPQYLHRGRVLDVVPGSALEQAIGADRLIPLRRAPVQQAAAPVPEALPEVFGAGGGGGAAPSVTAGGGGGGEYAGAPAAAAPAPQLKVRMVRTVGKKQDNAKDGAS